MISIVRAPDFIYELVNPAFQAMAPGKEFLGRRLADVWAEVSEPLVEILRNVIETGNTFKLEDAPYTIRRAPGAPLEVVYVSYSWIPLSGPDGKPDRILTLAHETTGWVRQRQELAEANRSLRESETFLRSLFDSPEVMRGIVELVDGVIVHVSCNETAATMYGIARESISGKSSAETGASESVAQEWVRLYQESRRTGKPVSMEYDRRDANGEERWLLATASYLGAGAAGNPRFAYTILDLTDRKRAEEALRGSEARLRQAQKLESLGLLAGGVAHDFNNLLVGVIGNASLAQEMLPPDHPAAELLDGVLKSGEQAAHLTRQMLAYSGKGKFVVEPLDLSALIPEMIGLVRPSIAKKITLQLDLAENLPAIEADRGQVQQVFLNLAINAAEAIGSRAGQIIVRTRVEDGGERSARLHPDSAALAPEKYVCLDVSDTGCGMDEATKAKIFDPFFSTKFIGRGLGLAAVSGIVRGHKGAITVSSAPDQGSCFTVLFPAAAQAAGRPADAARAAAFQGAGTVLVVDDEQMVREMVKRSLERHGYTVLLAESGWEAIEVFKRHPGEIALVVLDLSMPRMSGEETLPELRKIRPEIKVLVSSGYSESEAMTFFQGQRVSGFVQKPYTSTGIAERVKDCLR
jgi:PAS domain S-box-containing protein